MQTLKNIPKNDKHWRNISTDEDIVFARHYQGSFDIVINKKFNKEMYLLQFMIPDSHNMENKTVGDIIDDYHLHKRYITRSKRYYLEYRDRHEVIKDAMNDLASLGVI